MDLKACVHQCNTGNHTLVEVARCDADDCEEVVRWCSICGAIVVDVEVGGRLMKPGGGLKMMGPKALKLVQIYYD